MERSPLYQTFQKNQAPILLFFFRRLAREKAAFRRLFPCLDNYAAAGHLVRLVQYNRLPGGQSPLGLVESHLYLSARKDLRHRRLLRLMISGPGQHGNRRLGAAGRKSRKSPGDGHRAVNLICRSQHDGIVLRPDLADIQRRAAANAQAPALTYRIVNDSPVPPSTRPDMSTKSPGGYSAPVRRQMNPA